MNDPQTWTTGWGLTVGAGGGRGRREQWGKTGTTVIEQFKKKRKNTGSICCLLVENLKNREV